MTLWMNHIACRKMSNQMICYLQNVFMLENTFWVNTYMSAFFLHAAEHLCLSSVGSLLEFWDSLALLDLFGIFLSWPSPRSDSLPRQGLQFIHILIAGARLYLMAFWAGFCHSCCSGHLHMTLCTYSEGLSATPRMKGTLCCCLNPMLLPAV